MHKCINNLTLSVGPSIIMTNEYFYFRYFSTFCIYNLVKPRKPSIANKVTILSNDEETFKCS